MTCTSVPSPYAVLIPISWPPRALTSKRMESPGAAVTRLASTVMASGSGARLSLEHAQRTARAKNRYRTSAVRSHGVRVDEARDVHHHRARDAAVGDSTREQDEDIRLPPGRV